jgi:hypothetical protein
LKKRENIYKNTLSRLKTYNTNTINSTNNNFIQTRYSNSFINNNNSPNNKTYMSPQINNYGNFNNDNFNANLNSSYMTYNPQKNDLNISNFDKDDSFKYSYYLIDNLKNAINKVDFQSEYSNLL